MSSPQPASTCIPAREWAPMKTRGLASVRGGRPPEGAPAIMSRPFSAAPRVSGRGVPPRWGPLPRPERGTRRVGADVGQFPDPRRDGTCSKTQVLTLRIANLIAQGMAQPEEILAITFTHAATVNMRERLVKIIGPTAHQVNFHTFHELAAQIISESSEYFPLHQAQMVDDLQQLLLMEEIVATLPLVVLRPAGKKFFYVHELINAIGKLKQEAITPLAYYALMTASVKKLQQMIAQERDKKRPARGKIATWQKSIDKQKELAMVFAAYQHTLVRRGYYDYHDMIAMVVAALRQYPDLLATYQERWQYFLVDEYQDTNNAQAELLHLLASYWQAPNLFVVGDPQQAIYRFQGANLENFLLFAKQYPQVKEISLTCGYRCGQITYNLAHELILQQTQSSSRTGREVALQAAQ